jgi:hypothetical protein
VDGVTSLRDIESASIRAFVQRAADEGYLSGRVLDYGCGKQPYRDIVEGAGAEYVPYDRREFPGNVGGEDVGPSLEGVAGDEVRFDAILCTQVIQYIPPEVLLWAPSEFDWMSAALKSARGHLVLTYPTNWPEVEPEDLHRFTKAGMERLLTEAGFKIVKHERRADFYIAASPGGGWTDDVFATGYGVICRA